MRSSSASASASTVVAGRKGRPGDKACRIKTFEAKAAFESERLDCGNWDPPTEGRRSTGGGGDGGDLASETLAIVASEPAARKKNCQRTQRRGGRRLAASKSAVRLLLLVGLRDSSLNRHHSYALEG